ncbi:hypothetical protein [Kribbella pratensis]|uniref:Uncharacterized protein n=1 Tax=Kribbella pratensis TaxID=2512112 RepID=A0A4V3GF64_9ACTN|nr:hypothetical protein [Kribbella pratensis]TDW65619.1 hypothetical protein EV653_5630 [Kribbella pratensis]
MTTPREDQHWDELQSAFEQYMRQVLLGSGYLSDSGARRHATQLAAELLTITRQTLTGQPS